MVSKRIKALREGRAQLRAARAELQEALASLEMTGSQDPVPITFPEEPEWTEPFPGGRIRGVERDLEGLTLTLGQADAGVVVERHHHDRTETFHVIRGLMTVELSDGTVAEVRAGQSYEVPSRASHTVRYADDTVHLIVLDPPL
jgi:quercetin dioxygenase-like cupin family protein